MTCPIALFPATSESDKISFNQINKKTGHQIKYLKVDADTGEEVDSDDIIKGYKVDTDGYLERVIFPFARTVMVVKPTKPPAVLSSHSSCHVPNKSSKKATSVTAATKV
ncbi:hypothetical protein M2222_003934 [Bradyrhizobium elkanii]|nr:hypothetical protein [Bradyrhizobium elkanii]MCS3561612.1 hypothetical protein [Bradyrhizobium elkanii]MCW2148547.1 hypothetical protein [Bradyrhizobium elkanii]MCW2352366.1 hypothetical protein [Bradyrhizobium elkanii]MCW2372275.1 hypothetical protein [Bradyrhizobium elkanii]